MTREDPEESLKLRKEIWEKAVDTQMHFNEMSVKSRQLGLSFVVAALGLAVVLLAPKQGFVVQIPIPFTDYVIGTHVSAIIVLIAAAGLYAVKQLDLGVYHRMLRGAVAFGEEIERQVLRDELMKTPMGMTEFISLYSRHRKVEKKAVGAETIYSGKGAVTAEDKITKFYRLIIGVLLGIAIVLAVVFAEIGKTPQTTSENSSGQSGAQTTAK
jgi:hypothetical protein